MRKPACEYAKNRYNSYAKFMLKFICIYEKLTKTHATWNSESCPHSYDMNLIPNQVK